jgi:hypothetical protein
MHSSSLCLHFSSFVFLLLTVPSFFLPLSSFYPLCLPSSSLCLPFTHCAFRLPPYVFLLLTAPSFFLPMSSFNTHCAFLLPLIVCRLLSLPAFVLPSFFFRRCTQNTKIVRTFLIKSVRKRTVMSYFWMSI